MLNALNIQSSNSGQMTLLCQNLQQIYVKIATKLTKAYQYR